MNKCLSMKSDVVKEGRIACMFGYCLQAAKPSTKKVISPSQARRNAERLINWHEQIIFFLHCLTIGIEFFVPVCYVYNDMAVPLVPGFILIMVASIVALKLVSYAHCNSDLRYGTHSGFRVSLIPFLLAFMSAVCSCHCVIN